MDSQTSFSKTNLILVVKQVLQERFPTIVVHISNSLEDKGPNLEDYCLFQYFKYVFTYEVRGLSPKRDIGFTINLVPGVALVSKSHRMSTPELMKLKMQLQELMENKYIRPSVSP